MFCITLILVTHTCLGTPRIAKFRGSSLLSVCYFDYDQELNFKFNAYTKGELLTKFAIQKLQFFQSYVSLSWLSSIIKKGEFVSAFTPNVGFG